MNITIPYELIKIYNDEGIDMLEYMPIGFIDSKYYYNDYYFDDFNDVF